MIPCREALTTGRSQPVGHPRDRRARARPAVGAGHADGERPPGPYQIEAEIAALHDNAASAEDTDWRADPRLVRRPGRPHRRPGATGPRPPCSGARSRSATSSAPPRGCERPTGCARCSTTATAGTAVRGYLHEVGGDLPAAGAAYAEPPAERRTSPSASTSSVRPPARGPPRCGASPKPSVAAAATTRRRRQSSDAQGRDGIDSLRFAFSAGRSRRPGGRAVRESGAGTMPA